MKPRLPTYDEITRRTVIQPDGLFRPVPLGSDPPDPDLYASVADALLAIGHDEVGFEVVAAHKVILRGWLRDQATIDRIARHVAAATGAEVDNRMHRG